MVLPLMMQPCMMETMWTVRVKTVFSEVDEARMMVNMITEVLYLYVIPKSLHCLMSRCYYQPQVSLTELMSLSTR